MNKSVYYLLIILLIILSTSCDIYDYFITNDRPVAYAGEDQTVSVGEEVTLDGSGSYDPEGKNLGYKWFPFDGPEDIPENAEVYIKSYLSKIATFFSDYPGTFVLLLVVTDGNKDSKPDKITITVSL